MCIIAPLGRLLIIMGGLLGRGPMPRRIEDFVNYFAGRPTRLCSHIYYLCLLIQ